VCTKAVAGATFDVQERSEVPDEAFGGDVIAADWWRRGPSVEVAVLGARRLSV
jgi:hypothetical protein